MIWNYNHRTKIVFGAKSMEQLGQEAGLLGAKKIMLVTDPVMTKIGVTAKAVDVMGGYSPVVYDRVPSNPPYSAMDECIKICADGNCDAVVAIGGGSSIDIAKATALLAPTRGSALEHFSGVKAFDKPGFPLIAIPTTAGTGSEVNCFMVCTDPEKELKLAQAPPVAYPKVAILDPELLLTLPKNQTASTGVDAISHAIEAYWAQRAQPVSDMNALEAIRIMLEWLPVAYNDGGNLEARAQTLLASMYASFAFGNTGTAVCHSISYPLTVKWKLDHGYACAFTMPDALEWTWGSMGEFRQKRLLEAIGARDLERAVAKLREFTVGLGTPATLSDIGVKPEEIELIPPLTAAKNNANTNPPVTAEDIIGILKKKM